MSTPRYDIVMFADCHVGEARAADLAEEIEAQHAAGYTTALIDTPDLDARSRPPFAEQLHRCVRRGLVEVLPAEAAVSCALALVHSPRTWLASVKPRRVAADHIVAVMEEPTPDNVPALGDLAALVGRVTAARDGIRWAPRGPATRAALRCAGAALLDEDWPAVIDATAAPRVTTPAKRAIGRVAPVHPDAWPGARATLLAAYPDDAARPVRLFGDVRAALDVTGSPPTNWIVYPPRSLWLPDFYARIDVYVDAVRTGAPLAPGRNLLRALAAGVPAIVPERWHEQLGDACLAVAPDGVAGAIATLRDDASAREKLIVGAGEVLRERFARARHVERVEALIGRPAKAISTKQTKGGARARATSRAKARAKATASAGSAPGPGARKRVLFISSNGAGVGHLMRLMSIARRTSPDIEPIFFTLSQAVHAVRQMGFPVEYAPSHHYARLPGSLWHPFLRRRLATLIDLYRPSAVVFDGTAPYRGLLQAMAARPHIPFVWSRRAMWKPGLGERAIERSGDFHLIVEPGEFAGERDRGATVAHRERVTRTAPVMLFDPAELQTRDQARTALGLDPDRPAALVQLGAGNINDISSAVAIVVRRLLEEPDLQVCVASSIIGINDAPAFERVTELSVYPLGLSLRAFDFAVAASGYNTYHELLAAAVPSVFVPNLETALDDQQARAAHAEAMGVGFNLPVIDEAGFDRCVRALTDPATREEMSERCEALFPGNGAADAARAIESLIQGWEDHGAGLRARPAKDDTRLERGPSELRARAARKADVAFQRYAPTIRKDVRRRFRLASMVIAGDERTAAKAKRVPVSPGTGVDTVATAGLPTVLILAWGADAAALDELVDGVARLHRSRRSFNPLFVTDTESFGAFRRWGYVFEYVMPEAAWSTLEHPLAWEDYRARRLAQLLGEYAPEHIVTARSWGELEPVVLALVAGAR